MPEALIGSPVDRLAAAVERKTGWIVSELVRSKLARILDGIPESALNYWVDQAAKLPNDHPEWLAIIENLMVHETFFFRDWPQLDHLRKIVFPDLLGVDRRGQKLSILSAGCATGEEAYSLAILALEAMERGGQARRTPEALIDPLPGWSVEVTGVDLARPVLVQAQRGQYFNGAGLSSFRQMPPAYDCWFDIGTAPDSAIPQRQVKPQLRRFVSFQWSNLIEGLPEGAADFDLVVCRNVLIYLDAAARQKVLSRITTAVRTGGWLLLGPTDRFEDTAQWEPVWCENAVAYRRKARVAGLRS